MLRSMTLKAGSKVGPDLRFVPSTMTVFVGPNGSGKSLALREIYKWMQSGAMSGNHVVGRVAMHAPSEEMVEELVERWTPRTAVTSKGRVYLQIVKQDLEKEHTVAQIDPLIFRQAFRRARTQEAEGSDHSEPGAFTYYVFLHTVMLDGKSRFNLVEPRELKDLQKSPKNHLAALFQNSEAREEVRRIIYDAFQKHFVLDPTDPGKVRIRLSTTPPPCETVEQGWHTEAREFHRLALRIEDASDGVKAFTGIISALASADFRVILIDEPEAFLHPPLARKLGHQMAALAHTRSGNVFTATHSADFLMGAVEAGKDLNVVRLTYQQGQGNAMLLPSDRIRELMLDPLLRSTNVLNALFHSGAIVCEGDSDRCFYQEINHRLLSDNGLGVRDSVFLNAQNKQTIRRIVEPLRQMGIAAAAVVDLDIIKGSDLTNLLKACNVAPALVHSIGQLKGDLAAHFSSEKLDLHYGGISVLGGSERQAADSLLSQLKAFGVFVVPNGVLETWFPDLGSTKDKSEWLAQAFEYMGSDPEVKSYLKPATGGPWEFLRNIAEWVHDPNRSGMSSNS